MASASLFCPPPSQEDLQCLVIGTANGADTLTTSRERDAVENGLQEKCHCLGFEGRRQLSCAYRLLELRREQLVNGLWFDIFGTWKVGECQEPLRTSERGRVRRFRCMRNVGNDLEHQARILLHLVRRV